MSSRKRLISPAIGLLVLITDLGLTQAEVLQPLPVWLLIPGMFVGANLGNAPCSTTHMVVCSFWDVDYHMVNSPGLMSLSLSLDWALYSAVANLVWCRRSRVSKKN
jgi:hypothetical protein